MSFNLQVEEFEKKLICEILANANGKINKSAREGGIPKKTLLRKIRKYGISVVQYKKEEPPVNLNSEFPNNAGSESSQVGLYKLTQLIKVAKAIVEVRGHAKSNFSRDYAAGTAKYACTDCDAELLVSLHDSSGCSGSVLNTSCDKNKEIRK